METVFTKRNTKGFDSKLGKKKHFESISKSGKEAIKYYPGKLTGGITAEFYENCDKIPDPANLNPSLKFFWMTVT